MRRFMASVNVEVSLTGVLKRVKEAANRHAKDNGLAAICMPRVVAVSKTKPVEMIEAAYNCGQRHFGENYIQELFQKASHFKEKDGFDDIRWHFIGRLQRNKANNLCGAPNLFMVETVDSLKLADTLNGSWSRVDKSEKLKIMVQVNTSNEEAKGGCQPNECCTLVEHIITKCNNLAFAGLMTIGMPNVQSKELISDFQCLISCRKDVCRQLELEERAVELSMGMSADFEQAILAGSTNIRVGSTIFGQREYKDKQTEQRNTKTNVPSLESETVNETTICNGTDVSQLSLSDVRNPLPNIN